MNPSRNLGLLIAGAMTLACASSALLAQPGGGDRPLSIHRFVIPPERLAKELEKVQQGTLISLPLAEFDARFDRIRKAAQARELKPRLTRASYRAELVDRVLTNGSGQWTIRHPGKSPAVLPIDPFNLALHTLKWETGADALLAELDGKALGLLVKDPGVQTVLFDWSVRGTPTNDGLTFNLAIPPCPITSFELTLPAEYWLTAPKGAALVTGPSPAESGRHRSWQVQVTGQGQLEMTMRKIVDAGGPAPTVIAQVLSTQSLAPDRAQVDHEFQIEILHGSVRELALDGDGSLEPYEVSLRSGEIKAWQWKEPAAKIDAKSKSAAGVLTIQFHHPMQGKIQGLKVRSSAPRPCAKFWSSPALRVRDSLSRGETLKVQLHPNLAVGKWDSGTFQLMQTTTDSDGTQVITLADAAPDAPGVRRPAFWPVAAGIDLHTIEQYALRLDSRSAVLQADIEYALGRGSLSELRVRLPKTFPAYQVVAVEMQPADRLHRWYLSGDLLVAELLQPLTSAKNARLKVKLRADYRELLSGTRIVNYPDFEPLESTKREGSVVITVDPMLRAQLVSSTLPPLAFDDSAFEKRHETPSFAFAFRDQKLGAAFRLAPLPAQVHWQGRHTAQLADERASMQFRWDVEPIAGAPTFLDLRFAPGFPAVWKVRSDEATLRVHHWERLPLEEALPHLLRFGVRTPAQAALLEAMLPAGSSWRFHLTEPLRTKARLVIETGVTPESGPREAGMKTWVIPLMMPAQRAHVDQTVAVESSDELIDKVRAEGPFAIQTATGKSAPTQVQFVQTSVAFSDRASSLKLWTSPSVRAASMLELCDEARCTTEVREGCAMTYRIQFRLWHWRERTCELRLPAGVRVVAVKMHDRWLDRLDVRDEPTGTHVHLPFDQNGDFVRYDILARATTPTASFLAKIEVPTIGWPAPPADLAYAWRLGKGLMPFDSGAIEQIGLPDRAARQTPTVRWLRQWWNRGSSWFPSSQPTELAERLESQKQTVLSAEAQFRAQAAKEASLSETLEQFAVHHLKERVPLVIDDVACRTLGIRPETMLPAPALDPHTARPFWESLGLVYLPCPGGALLTSPERIKELGIDGPAQETDLEPAIAEAVLHGHDASGGLFFVLSWLQTPHADRSFPASAVGSAGTGHADDFHDITSWRLVAGPTPSAAFWVIDTSFARAVGVMLAIFIALLLWQVQRTVTPGTAFRVILLTLTASAALAIWLPFTCREFFAVPVLTVEGIGLLGCLIRLLRQSERTKGAGESTIVKPSAGAAVVALMICMPWLAEAQLPTTRSYPVLVVEGARPAVLFTPDLLTKLDELENPAISGTPDGVLSSAKYTGKIRDAAATFDVQYEIHTFKDQVNLVIPLSGVQLQEGAFLDGAPVYPTLHKNGYAVPVRNQGVHHLRLSFTARIVTTNDHLDLRFTIPKLAQNEITVQTPASMPSLQCLHCAGDDSIRKIPGALAREWHAQLGCESVVHLRWPNAAAAPTAKMVEVREAHCWDLWPSSFGLASSFNFAIGNGSVGQLSVAVPEGLHIRSVEAMSLSPGGPATPIVVKQWQMLGKGAQREVLVDFTQPVNGQVVLGFDFVAPALANHRTLALPLPAPLKSKSVSGILGYRLNAAEIRGTAQNLAVKNMDAESFEQQWRGQWSHPLPPELRAYSFQRKAQQAGLELVIQPPARQAQMQIRWNLEPQFAEVKATTTLSSTTEDLSLVEFFIDPSMTLAGVAGPDVQRWHLQDAVLQIWLRQSRKQTTLELTGWHAFDKGLSQNPKQRFAVPMIYPLQARFAAATLQIQPARGIHLDAEVLRRVHADGVAKLHWIIEDTPYEAAFSLRPESSPPEATLLTTVQNTDQGIELAYNVRLLTERGKLPPIKVRLQNGIGEPMRIEADGALIQSNGGPSRNSAWNVRYPAGLPQEVHLTVRGRVPAMQAQFALPTVELEGIPFSASWCAWTGVELANARTGDKLTNDPGAREEIIRWQGQRWQKDLAAWRCAKALPALKVLLAKTLASTNLPIVAYSEEMQFTDARKWLHKASFWLQAPESTDLRVKFPARLDHLSVFLDHRLVSAGRLDGVEAKVSIGATGQLRHVEMHWVHADEPIDAPNLAAPQIASARIEAPERLLWQRHGLIASPSPAPSVPTLLPHALHEAESHMQIAAALAQEAGPAARKLLQGRQRAFFVCVRQAEFLATVLRTVKGDFDAAPWRTRLADLRGRNAVLAKERGYAEERQAAERLDQGASILIRAAHPGPGGVPLRYTSDQSELPLEFARAHSSSERRARLELVLLIAVFLLVFSYFRRGLAWVRTLAPELAAAALLLGMWLGGAGLIGAVGVAAMICVRLAWLIRIRHRHRQMLTTDFDVSKHPSTKNRPTP